MQEIHVENFLYLGILSISLLANLYSAVLGLCSTMNIEKYQRICLQLETLRKEGNPYWNAGPETVDLIISYIRSISQCRMLEIGSSNGYTALRVAPALVEVQGTLVTIESHTERGDSAQANFKESCVTDVVTLVRGHAPEICGTLTGTFDLVFLDATKYEHESYVSALLPFLGTHAVIIADNILSHADAMKPFVDYMKSASIFSVEILPLETGILVAKKQI